MTQPEYSVQISREWLDPEWDRFVVHCPGGHPEQTSLWGKVKGAYGWQPFRITVRVNQRILGGVQVLTTDARRLGRIGYVTRGPLVASDDPRLTETILQQVNHAAADEKLAYLAVVLPYNGFLFEDRLVRLGFRRKPSVLPPTGLMMATVMLDITPDMESLTAQMGRTTRQNIRRAARNGVKVREGTSADVDTFRVLMWALCRRRGTSPTPHQSDFFERLWDAFQPAGFLRLFVAELQGQPISALMTFPFGDTVYAWKMGWAGDHAESNPNHLLFSEAIRWSKASGYRYFDFVGIENDLARTLLRGDHVDDTSVNGPDTFKLRFGGNPVLLPDPYYQLYHPLLKAWARAGGRRLLESQAVSRLLARAWDTLASHA